MSFRRRLRTIKQQLTIWLDTKRAGLYMDQTTARLMQILGATTLVVGGMRRNGRPLTIVLWRGALLRSEQFRLTHIDGKTVLGNDLKYAIALEDDDRTRDILVEQKRDEWLAENGWQVRWIPANWLNQPSRVKQSVGQFIYQ